MPTCLARIDMGKPKIGIYVWNYQVSWAKNCSDDICQKIEICTPSGQDNGQDPNWIDLNFSACENFQVTKFSGIELHNTAQLFAKGRFRNIYGSLELSRWICENEILRFSKICLPALQELMWERQKSEFMSETDT